MSSPDGKPGDPAKDANSRNPAAPLPGQPAGDDEGRQPWNWLAPSEEIFACDWALPLDPNAQASPFNNGRSDSNLEEAQAQYFLDWN